MTSGLPSTDHLNPTRPGAILYRTHFWNAAIEAEVLKLTEAVGDRYDVWVIFYVEPWQDFATPAWVRKLIYTERHLRALGLAQHCACMPGAIPLRNIEVALLHFYRMMPEYSHTWMIECDVRYSGDWDSFFRELDDPAVDFLGTAVQRRPEQPAWPHWHSLCTGNARIAAPAQVKSFTPLIRLTRRAFAAVDAAYRRGWHGHYEALWPTAIEAVGGRIEDIGGDGTFTPGHRRGRHYTRASGGAPGSFVFRPVKQESDVAGDPPLLWHPVKTPDAPAWLKGAAPN